MAKAGRPRKNISADEEGKKDAHPGDVAQSDYPTTLKGLLTDPTGAWQLTHKAENGNDIYTRHNLEGMRYAEVDSDGKVVEVRSDQHANG